MMWSKLMHIFASLPIVRLISEHNAERQRSDSVAAESMAQQHDIARRVHVLEWMTYPHTQKPKGDRQ